MKKLGFLLGFLLIGYVAAAQNYMVVDSEKVFKAIGEYNTALTTIEAEGERYQKQVDDAFAQLEQTFNTYQSRKGSMSASDRAATEQRIVERENEITKFQQDTFGEEGTMTRRRVELIKPIEDRVFAAIRKYATDNGYDVVLDVASNPTVLYYNPRVDHTDAVIAIVR